MTPRRLNLPDTAKIAVSDVDGRIHAPSAARNAQPILEVIRRVAPVRGTALEIASGTGEHVAAFATALPALIWQPTDIDEARLASIAAWTTDLANVRPPIRLDATAPGWSEKFDPPNLIFLSNLLHLIGESEARTCVTEAGRLLAPNGILLVYGPFKRGDGFASDGDLRFHQDLAAQDPSIGYKAFQTVQAWQAEAWLQPVDVIEMPANNLILSARKPS